MIKGEENVWIKYHTSIDLPGFLHGDDHNAVILLGMVTEDGDDEVGVEWV